MRRLVVRHDVLEPPGWPVALDGLRLGIASDFHAGSPGMGEVEIAHVVERLNSQQPELVVLLGDYGMGHVLGGRRLAPGRIGALLGALEAPLGVLAVLGNNDWDDGPAIRDALRGHGVDVLENELRLIERGGARFCVAGMADKTRGLPQPVATVRQAPAGASVIALIHNPDLFPGVPASVPLTLAGHTHGGQIALPWLGPLMVPSRHGRRFAHRLVEEHGRLLYVTSGLGTNVLPLRFGVPPEIVVLELRSGSADAAATGDPQHGAEQPAAEQDRG